jgi:hypothetical protein
MVSNHYNFTNIMLMCGYELNAKTMDHISFLLCYSQYWNVCYLGINMC